MSIRIDLLVLSVKVMMMIHESPEHLEKRTGPAGQGYRDAWTRYYKEVAEHTISGHPLDFSVSPRTIREVDGEQQVQDGAFADSRESLVGYCIFEVEMFDEAIELASTCPCIERGAVDLMIVAEERKIRGAGRA